MAVILTILYIAVGIGFFFLFPAQFNRHQHVMTLIMSFSMVWGLGIGSITPFWFPHFFQGVHVGMYTGAFAGGLVGRRVGLAQVLNGLVSGLMGGMMGAMLVYMTPETLQLRTVFWLALFNGVVLSLILTLWKK